MSEYERSRKAHLKAIYKDYESQFTTRKSKMKTLFEVIKNTFKGLPSVFLADIAIIAGSIAIGIILAAVLVTPLLLLA